MEPIKSVTEPQSKIWQFPNLNQLAPQPADWIKQP